MTGIKRKQKDGKSGNYEYHYQDVFDNQNNRKKERIEQKVMTFDHGSGYSYPLFSSLLNKEDRRIGE